MSLVFKQDERRSCHAAIIWATTVKGKAMPVDYDPSEDGTVVLHYRPGRSPLAVVIGAGQTALGDAPELRKSHFSTCPQADEHRRRR